ncbi:hypothetical protein PQX77_017296, partial [Marasmius sp. AFHP31]
RLSEHPYPQVPSSRIQREGAPYKKCRRIVFTDFGNSSLSPNVTAPCWHVIDSASRWSM